jgi:U3 small nucleolar RNA-associated protein 15
MIGQHGQGSKKFKTIKAMDYQPVVVQAHRRPHASKHNPESRHWRQYKRPVFIKEYAPVTAIHFSPCKPHRYAVTSATRVQIYAPRTQKITKTISRFKDVARSGNIRSDGKLVVAGDDTGLIQARCYSTLFALSLTNPLAGL